MNLIIYFAGILLQAIAGTIALVQVRLATRKLPWLLIALSALLVVFRRAITVEKAIGPDIDSRTLLMFLITLLFLAGVLMMSNMFRDVVSTMQSAKVSEERYRNISASISDFVFSCVKPPGGNCEIDWLAGNIEKISGYSRQEVVDKRNWRFFVHPEDLPIFDKNITGIEHNGSNQCELRIIHKDGSIRWLRAAFRFAPENGSLAGRRLFGSCEDITERKRIEEALRRSEEEKSAVMNSLSPIMVEHIDPRMRIIWTNGALIDSGGESPESLKGKYCYEVTMGLDQPCENCTAAKALKTGRMEQGELETPDGRTLLLCSNPVVHGETVTGVVHVAMDISERKRSEERLRHANRELQAVVKCNHALIQASDEKTLFTDVCKIICDVGGYRMAWVGIVEHDEQKSVRPAAWAGAESGYLEKIGITWADTERGRGPSGTAVRTGKTSYFKHFETDPHMSVWRASALSRGYKSGISIPLLDSEKKVFAVWNIYSSEPTAFRGDEIRLLEDLASHLAFGVLSLRSLSGRKKAEQEREKLQGQLLQSQKMESVGRLAGGVAHDYNNMLAVIIGYAELALDKVQPGDELRADLQEVLKAATRSADITRQLLAFARKQAIAPVVLDINETVEGMLKMLHRLIGEDIDLAWLPGAGLWPVRMDPSQIDQVLANLCVNARDAIAGVGKVTIETDTVIFDEAYCVDHADFMPGEFVLLAVSDDGCGMDQRTLQSIFEPFFTTKGVDRGTGLGLATVYGIVKQNSGFINVYSEPDRGTTFKIYLPRAREQAPKEIRTEAVKKDMTGTETILLVEDEGAILTLGKAILKRQGYLVLAARNGAEALAIVRGRSGPLHLLITDVVMPEMNGRELRDQLRTIQPDLKCIFMSGYTANVIVHHGVLDEGADFIQKPFGVKTLAEKVRKVLDS